MIRHKKTLLLIVLFVAGLAFSGCVAGAGQTGWSGVAIADDTLFFGSMKGELVALDLNGISPWQPVPLEVPGSTGGAFGCAPPTTPVVVYGTPAVGEDLVYAGGYNGEIHAITFDRGALRWVYPRQGNIGAPIVGGIIVSQGKLYFSSANGNIYALDAETGDWSWTFQTGDKIWSTPAIDGDTLFIGSFDKKLYAIDTATGRERWPQPFVTQGPIVATPLVYDNTVYVGSFDRYFYAIDASDGQMKWKSRQAAEKWFWASPVAHKNTIYAPSSDGRVYVFDAESGERMDVIDLDSPISSSPVVVNDKVIVATEEGKLYSIDTASYQFKQLANLEDKIYAPLSASDGLVYIHSQRGIIHEVDVQTGAKRQLYQIN